MKSDIESYNWLFIPAIAGLMIFIILMPYTHPPSHILDLSSRDTITSQSQEFLENAAFSVGQLEPFVVFLTNDDLISEQIAYFGKNRLNTFIQNGFLRFIPSYHWQVTWHSREIHDDVSLTVDSFKQPIGSAIFRTVHSPDGKIQQFHIVDASGLNNIRPGVTPSLPLNEPAAQTSSLQPQPAEHQAIKRLIRNTVWDSHIMVVDSVYHSAHHNQQVTNVILNPDAEIFEHNTYITVKVSSDGHLYGIEQTVTINNYRPTGFDDTIDIIRVIFYVVAIVLLLTIFFRRFFYRLIDVRTAIIYAAIAVCLFLLHLMHLLFQASAFDHIDRSLEIIAFMTTLLLLSGVGGFFVFMITGLGESFSREVWPEKITSLTLLRLGYIKSKNIGSALVSGVLGALMLLGLSAITYSLFDNSYLSNLSDQLFYSQSFMVPGWQIFIRSLYWAMLISAGLFACFLSWIAINKKKQFLLLITGGIVFSLMTSINIETPDATHVLLAGFIPGLAITYIFLKHDLLTLFISFFLFLLNWSTAEGWLVTNSPDLPISVTIIAVTASLLIVGIYLVIYGDEHKHIPELTPGYILEIAREQRVERELEIAHQVHQSFLPINLPEIPGVEIAANCQAAFDVGGDYYDVISISDSRLAFVIGDVSGKGIQAAFYMTMVKGIFQSLVKEISDPIPLLTRMNRLFYANAQRGSFISLCYGILDAQNGKLTYARAGHNPAILVRADDNSVKMLRTTGLALGLTQGDEFEESLSEQHIDMNPGDTLIFYTDGFTEATNPSNEMFGDDRLISEIRNHSHLDAQALMKHISDCIHRFTSYLPVSDDMTMVIVKIKKE